MSTLIFYLFLLNVVTHNITGHVRIRICVQKLTNVRNPTCPVITSTRHKLHPKTIAYKSSLVWLASLFITNKSVASNNNINNKGHANECP